MTDAELIAASVNHPQAFEDVVLRHFSVISRYVMRRVGPQNADDVVSEVFAIAFARRRRFDQSYPSAAPWLFGIATNLIRRQMTDEVRALRRYGQSHVDPAAPDADPAERGFDPELAGVLAEMRPEHRDALFLSAVAELSVVEIAAAMDVAQGTVKSWLSRGRAFAVARLSEANTTMQREGEPDG